MNKQVKPLVNPKKPTLIKRLIDPRHIVLTGKCARQIKQEIKRIISQSS
jgi:hypothetical protein